MSTKYIRTTADLVRFGADLRVDCTNCHATRTLSGAEAVQRLGAGDLRKAQKRLRCARCGRKAARLIPLDPL